MATTALVVFDVDGELHGCEFARMGFFVPEMLNERFHQDVAGLREYLLVGSARGGYRTAETENPFLDEVEADVPLTGKTLLGRDGDVTYLVTEDGTLVQVELEVKVMAVPVK